MIKRSLIGLVAFIAILACGVGGCGIDESSGQVPPDAAAKREQTPTQPAPAPTPTQTPTSPPPQSLGLDPYYEKYLDAGGIPIVGLAKVPDEAFYQARTLIDEMLAGRPDIRSALAAVGVRVVIMPVGAVITDLPEFSDLYETNPGTDWDERFRGGGVGPSLQIPVMVVAEENLLCYETDIFPYEDVFVHEFAHAVHDPGITIQREGAAFQRRLEAAYREALDSGLWEGTYAATNPDEYWAEGVQSWFGLNDPPGSLHNHVDTRAELEAYDPALAELILEVFGDATVPSSCHENTATRYRFIRGVIVGPEGGKLQGIGLWAWQVTTKNHSGGQGESDQDGAFAIQVPDGLFTLDVYAGPGCSFVGWYDGDGITTDRDQAVWVSVSGADVGGIEIRLPSAPEDLPRIEWCADS